MSDLSEELRGLQAVLERFGVDDDGALNRAAECLDRVESTIRPYLPHDKFPDYDNIWQTSKCNLAVDVQEAINNG